MKKNSLKKIILFPLAALCAAALFSSCAKKDQELHIYSIIHDEETKALTDLFTEKSAKFGLRRFRNSEISHNLPI